MIPFETNSGTACTIPTPHKITTQNAQNGRQLPPSTPFPILTSERRNHRFMRRWMSIFGF